LPEAKEKYFEAASLWDVCYKRNKKNSLNNEATAYSGAANIAFNQQHFEESKELYGKAIAVARSGITEDGDVYSAQINRLNLSKFLLSSAEPYVATDDLDSAFSASEEARKIAKEVLVPDLANRGKSYLGSAETLECFITARRKSPADAQKYCDDALATLEPMRDIEGGKFKDYLAQALFVQGMVQEDMKLWGPALTSFKGAEALWSELSDAGQSQFKADQAKAAFYSVGAAYYSGDHNAAVENARRAVLLTDGLPTDLLDFRRMVLTEAADLLDGLGNHMEAAEIIRKRDNISTTSQ
jgi:tetratricopeptide (TPR) repeat protein